MIDSAAVMIVAFESVTVDKSDLGIFVYGNTARAFAGQTILIFSVHDTLTEVALIDVEVCRV